MDGRKLFVMASFALGSCLGCVPNQNKNAPLEAHDVLPEAVNTSAPSSMSSINPFSEKPKKAPNLEVSFAINVEKNARLMLNEPEKHSKQLDLARKIYQEIINYEPNCIEAHRGLGRVYIAMGDFERATATFKKAIEKHPNEAAVYAEFSIVYSKRNDFPEAIRLLKKATEIDPENQEFQRMLGVDYVCNGQIELGLAAMTRARGPSAAHYYIARVYERKGQRDLAKQELAKAIQANPNLQEARAMLDEMEGRQPSAPSAPAANRSDVLLTNHEQR